MTTSELFEVVGVHVDGLAIDSKEEIEERRRFLLQGAQGALVQYDEFLWEVAEDARTGPIPTYTCLSPEDIERAWEEVELERVYLECSSRATSAPQQHPQAQQAAQYRAEYRIGASAPAQQDDFEGPVPNQSQHTVFNFQQPGSHGLTVQEARSHEQPNIRGGELSDHQPLFTSRTPVCDAIFQPQPSYRFLSPPMSMSLKNLACEATNQKIAAKGRVRKPGLGRGRGTAHLLRVSPVKELARITSPKVTVTPAPTSTPTKMRPAKQSGSITSRVTPLKDTTANASRVFTTPTKCTVTTINTILSPPKVNTPHLRPATFIAPLNMPPLEDHVPPLRAAAKVSPSLEASTVRLAIANVWDELRQRKITGAIVTGGEAKDAQQPDGKARGTTPDPIIPSAICATRQTDNIPVPASPAPVKTSPIPLDRSSVLKRRDHSRSISPDDRAHAKRQRVETYTQNRRARSHQAHTDTAPQVTSARPADRATTSAQHIQHDTSPPRKTTCLHPEIPSDDQSHPSYKQLVPICPSASISAVLDRAQKYVAQEPGLTPDGKFNLLDLITGKKTLFLADKYVKMVDLGVKEKSRMAWARGQLGKFSWSVSLGELEECFVVRRESKGKGKQKEVDKVNERGRDAQVRGWSSVCIKKERED